MAPALNTHRNTVFELLTGRHGETCRHAVAVSVPSMMAGG